MADLQRAIAGLSTLQRPELFAEYYTGKLGYGSAMLGVIWTRIAALQVVTTALLGGVSWLAGEMRDASATNPWWIALTAVLATTIWGGVQLVVAAWPKPTADPYRLNDLLASITADRQQFRAALASATEQQLDARQHIYEQSVLLLSLCDVADQMQIANGKRLYALRTATVLLVTATGALFFLAAAWLLVR